jgi:hypothetical protein
LNLEDIVTTSNVIRLEEVIAKKSSDKFVSLCAKFIKPGTLVNFNSFVDKFKTVLNISHYSEAECRGYLLYLLDEYASDMGYEFLVNYTPENDIERIVEFMLVDHKNRESSEFPLFPDD